MYDVARSAEAPVVFGRMFTRILAAYAFVGLGMCLMGDVAVGMLGGDPYAGASEIIAPVLLGCMCQGAVSLMDAGLYVQHRSGVKLGITLLATVVMVTEVGGAGGSLGTTAATCAEPELSPLIELEQPAAGQVAVT